MKYFVTINGKKFEVDVEREEVGTASNTASNANTANTVQNNTPLAPSGAGESVVSPMPGTILDVKVKEGQAVKKGDVLFILEAMKMENEIIAGHDAVISKVLVSKGTSVKTGDGLAELR